MLQDGSEFSRFMGDYHWAFIVDRGFRDAIAEVSSVGHSVQMPKFLQNFEKQHSTYDANASRLVTKIRWVVEAANGRFKKFKIFSNVLSIHNVPTIHDDLRIISSLLNRYRDPLNQQEHDAGCKLAEAMRSVLQNLNALSEQCAIVRGTMRSLPRDLWEPVTNEFDFPVISEGDLQAICFGTYQLRMAKVLLSRAYEQHRR